MGGKELAASTVVYLGLIALLGASAFRGGKQTPHFRDHGMTSRPFLLPACFAVLACGAAPRASAGELLHELRFGLLAHDVGGLWSGFNEEDGADVNIEASLTPSLALAFATLRPAIGASINTEGDTSKLYAGARLEREIAMGLFLAAGVGAAIHDGKLKDGHRGRKALGARVLFHIPVEAGYRLDDHHSLSIYFDHVSNAFLADENEGMDTLGLRYGYRF